MTWLQTKSRLAVDILDPKPETIRLADIAWSLARQPRYLGHTDEVITVGEHCIRLSLYFNERKDYAAALWALLHDAHEAYLGDMIYPVWSALSPDARAELNEIKHRFDMAILTALWPINVEWPSAAVQERVREADRRILIDERLHGFGGVQARPWGDHPAGPIGIGPARADLFWASPKAVTDLYQIAYKARVESLGGTAR